MADLVVEARSLTKRFGVLTAVDAIDFAVYRGEAFGFLGPNGAGKSSTMRMVGATSPPTDGFLRVLGRDPGSDGQAIRSRLGVVPQEDTLDTELTVFENLLIYGRYFGFRRAMLRERIERLLDFVQLAERRDSKVDHLSGGMKRRLVIARALVSEPEVMLLDEPTTGLDPQARHLVWDRLYRLKQQGVTLILTTHYMDEAEQLCDRLVIMHEGRILIEGSPRGLIRDHTSREVLEVFEPPEELRVELEALGATSARLERLADRWLFYLEDGEALLAKVRALPLDPGMVWLRGGTLEDVFLALTGRGLLE